MSDASTTEPVAGLNQLEEQLLAEFTSREATEPTPTPTTPTTPTTEASTGDPAVEGGDASPQAPSGVEEPGATTPPDPPESEQTSDSLEPPDPSDSSDPGVGSVWGNFAGDPATNEQHAASVYSWYQGLTAQQMQTVDQSLSGDYVMVPVAQVTELQEAWDEMQEWKSARSQNPPTPNPNPNPNANAPVPDYPEYGNDPTPDYPPTPTDATDPIARAAIAELQQTQMEQQVHAEAAANAAIIDEVGATWMTQHPFLTESDYGVIQDYIVNTGTFGALSQQYGVAEATRIALDQAAAVIPNISSKILDERVNARLQESQEVISQQSAVGQRASAISGAGSNPPGAIEADGVDPMVEEIRRSMYGG